MLEELGAQTRNREGPPSYPKANSLPPSSHCPAIRHLPWPEPTWKPVDKRGRSWSAPRRQDGAGEGQSLGLGIRQAKDWPCLPMGVASAIKSGGTVCNGAREKEGFLLGQVCS